MCIVKLVILNGLDTENREWCYVQGTGLSHSVLWTAVARAFRKVSPDSVRCGTVGCWQSEETTYTHLLGKPTFLLVQIASGANQLNGLLEPVVFFSCKRTNIQRLNTDIKTCSNSWQGNGRIHWIACVKLKWLVWLQWSYKSHFAQNISLVFMNYKRRTKPHPTVLM